MLKGAQIKYGDEFNRKIYVYDPSKRDWDTIEDDGTYIIKDDKIVGR